MTEEQQMSKQLRRLHQLRPEASVEATPPVEEASVEVALPVEEASVEVAPPVEEASVEVAPPNPACSQPMHVCMHAY